MSSSSSKRKYELTFSRECLLLTLEVWYHAENDFFPKYIKQNLPKRGYMFFEYKNGIAADFIEMAVVRKIVKKLIKKILKNKNYFLRVYDDFWRYLKIVRPYFKGKKRIRNESEFITFFENACEMWAINTVFYWLTYFEDFKLPHNFFKKAKRARLRLEMVYEDLDRVFAKALKKIFGNLYIPLHNFLSFDEVVNNQMPAINVLKKRTKYIIYYKDQIYEDILIKDFLRHEQKQIIKPKIDSESIKGVAAFAGLARGKVKVCFRHRDTAGFKKGSILVSPMTTPLYLPAAKKAAAIVTDEGGVTCHAAIVAREMNKPCIIGTKIATKVLKDGDLVEVDANNGIVKILKRR